MSAAEKNYAEDEFRAKLHVLTRELAAPLRVTTAATGAPTAVFVGGQEGSGSTWVHALFKQELPEGAIVIDHHSFLPFHPRYHELCNAFGPDATRYAAPWAQRMAQELIDAFSRMRYNLILEGALRAAEKPQETAQLLRDRGYTTVLAIPMVRPEISLLNCRILSEEMGCTRISATNINPDEHVKRAHEMIDRADELARSKQFDRTYVINSSGARVAPRTPLKPLLLKTLFGPRDAQEDRHYLFLKQKLERLRAVREHREKQHV